MRKNPVSLEEVTRAARLAVFGSALAATLVVVAMSVAGLPLLAVVARHQVGGADQHPGVAVALEYVDARVLEEPAHHRDHVDVVGDAGDPGPQAGDAANVQLDPHACLRGLVQSADEARVYERVHL